MNSVRLRIPGLADLQGFENLEGLTTTEYIHCIESLVNSVDWILYKSLTSVSRRDALGTQERQTKSAFKKTL